MQRRVRSLLCEQHRAVAASTASKRLLLTASRRSAHNPHAHTRGAELNDASESPSDDSGYSLCRAIRPAPPPLILSKHTDKKRPSAFGGWGVRVASTTKRARAPRPPSDHAAGSLGLARLLTPELVAEFFWAMRMMRRWLLSRLPPLLSRTQPRTHDVHIHHTAEQPRSAGEEQARANERQQRRRPPRAEHHHHFTPAPSACYDWPLHGACVCAERPPPDLGARVAVLPASWLQGAS